MSEVFVVVLWADYESGYDIVGVSTTLEGAKELAPIDTCWRTAFSGRRDGVGASSSEISGRRTSVASSEIYHLVDIHRVAIKP